jgi:hypothetical protein
MDHIFLVSGLLTHVQDQTDAGGPHITVVPHIGVGADMGQAIEILINRKGLSTFQQPTDTNTMN